MLCERYSKGVKIWIPDTENVWIGATVLKFLKDKNSLEILTDNGSVAELKLNHKPEIGLPLLRNPDILIGQKDLTSLSYLNEPEVLYNLQIRFCDRREIYTYCGIVLVAINPYQELPIYGNEIINAYHLQNSNDLDPHIFAVAENAFRRMSSFDENQSVIVSGESGAGKTVSAKYTMRYFALVGGSKSKQSSYNLGETQIERKVLLSNPILEAMGNAKTIRNDNSSRFGKYLEIMFNRKNQINGANMYTYLLEKSRVVFQSLGERNYHIFYQIVNHSQTGDELLINSGLVNNIENYNYLKYGESPEIDGVDDSDEFLVTKNSFIQLGIDLIKLKTICEILAAILHLGNIQFRTVEATEGSIIENPSLLRLIGELLGCPADQLKTWLCFRTITTLRETLHKPLSKSEAQYFRDALVKTLYSKLFDWIVKNTNKCLSCDITSKGKKATKKSNDKDKSICKKFIGVLDIYGFETFEENSFEQFCINFANEKLQLQFNMHVFKLEQEEYMNEGLEWSFIDYYNNQPCIDLIESRLGLLDLLDEECKLVKGSDENWCCKIYSHHLNKSYHFKKPKMSNSAFVIEHFAGSVEYECSGFIEKNRDSVLEEQINLLKASDVSLIAELFIDDDMNRSASHNSKSKSNLSSPKNIQVTKQENSRKMKKTVGSQFKTSLKMLMEILDKTNPHYVRCIKPNDLKLPFTFCPERAVQQLRACGVIETIRLSASGFPSRWTYQDFYQRYYILLSKSFFHKLDCKVACQTIVESLIQEFDTFRFGKSKLFFRAGQVAQLEKLRSEKIENSVTLIQSALRGSIERKKYFNIIKLVGQLQSLIRRKFALIKVKNLRQNKAAIKIQSVYRMYIERRNYLKMKMAIIVIENWWRKIILIKLRLAYKKERDIILCQSIIRSFCKRQMYLKMRNAIIQLQSHFRRRKAKKQLKLLRMEAKSLNHIKFVNKGLENKIIELTQRLDEKEKEIFIQQNKLIKDKKIEIEILKQNQLEEINGYVANILELKSEISKLKKDLNREICEKNKINSEKEKLEIAHQRKIQELNNEIEDLKLSLASIGNSEIVDEVNVVNHESSSEMKEKFINEQLDHQKLVQDYEKLELKYENLYKEFVFVKSILNKSTGDSVDGLESASNISESDSCSTRDDADIDSLSDETDTRSQKQKSSVVAKKSIEYCQETVSTAGDLAAVIQLQIRVNSMGQENHRLKEIIQDLEDQLLKYKTSEEIQIDVPGGDNDFSELIHSNRDLNDSNFKTKLLDKINYLKKQLKQQNDECQKLQRNMISGTLGKLADALHNERSLVHCEEELQMALDSQKEANRKMFKELEELKIQDTFQKKALTQSRKEKELLQIQIGKQQMFIKRGIGYINKLQNIKLTPKEKFEKFVQNEISRILIENLKLQERNDQITSESIQLKRGLKYFALRLQRYEGALVPNPSREEDLLQLIQSVIYNSKLKSEGMKECCCEVGLIDLTMSELTAFIKTFVFDLSPNTCIKYEPYHLVSYIMFLVTRKFDVFEEEENMRKFLTKLISALKKTIRKRKDCFDYLIMWLSNVFCLLNLFQQYSGTKQFSDLNSNEENKHNFIRYDLSVFIRLLKELCVTSFQLIMQHIVENYLPQSLCIDAILKHEGIKTLMSKDGAKCKQDFENQHQNTSFNTLMKNLQLILETLRIHYIPPALINQIFVHIASLINAYCLNTLLFQADLCYFSKGVQIRYNLSSFETWIRLQKLGDSGALKCLRPMTEAVQLLQTLLRSEEDAQIVCDMCEFLTTSQIIKILHNFNPRDGWGCSLPNGLILYIEALMKAKRSNETNDNELETPTTIVLPIDIPHIHRDQSLNCVVIPKSLYLPCINVLTKKDLL